MFEAFSATSTEIESNARLSVIVEVLKFLPKGYLEVMFVARGTGMQDIATDSLPNKHLKRKLTARFWDTENVIGKTEIWAPCFNVPPSSPAPCPVEALHPLSFSFLFSVKVSAEWHSLALHLIHPQAAPTSCCCDGAAIDRAHVQMLHFTQIWFLHMRSAHTSCWIWERLPTSDVGLFANSALLYTEVFA